MPVPRWDQAYLSVERLDCRIAALPFNGQPAVAVAPLADAQNQERPSSWGGLPAGGSATGLLLDVVWSVGHEVDGIPEPVGAGPSWETTNGNGYWIISGLLADAPHEWERPDGTRWPAAFDHLASPDLD